MDKMDSRGGRTPQLSPPIGRDAVAARLAEAGCVAADEEAAELIDAARGDESVLEELLNRRTTGEPLAWVTGWSEFLGHQVRVRPGVYVPRWQTEALVRRAIALLPDGGLAADFCTGSGAVAVALQRARPTASVVATDIDPVACECARQNGVEVFEGDLGDPFPRELSGHFDLVFGVVPYVPTKALIFLPRDVREHEPVHALDGGPEGTGVLERAVFAAQALLRPGGALLLELGAEQDRAIHKALIDAGFGHIRLHVDNEGDLRGIEATLRTPIASAGARENKVAPRVELGSMK